MWWRDAVVYQIYPALVPGLGRGRRRRPARDHRAARSPGLARRGRLLALADLPLAAGRLRLRRLRLHGGRPAVRDARATSTGWSRRRTSAGCGVLLDLVPCHTSIEHPWFREHPDWYIWSPVDGPPNNWVAAFGGSAWSRDEQSGRWYLHSFYPEQPDLDWRNPEVVEAMQDVVRFWRDRGADGFRLDAIDRLVKDDQLRDDPPATEPFPLPLHEDAAKLEHALLRQPARGDRGAARDPRGRRRRAARRRGLPPGRASTRATSSSSTSSSCSSSSSRPGTRSACARRSSPAAELGRVAWVMSNHDFDRLATPRRPRERARGRAAPAHAARRRLRLPGRRDRPRERARRRPALRPRRPRPAAPSDAVGREPDRRLHHRRAVAAPGRPAGAQRRRPSAATPARC